MRRTLAAVAVAVLLVLVGATPATAAEPLPPGVTPIPDLPSNTVRMTPTTSGSWTATDIWKAQLWYASQPGKEMTTLPNGIKTVVAPKPITAAGAVVRGGTGPVAGTALAGFNLGWAIGQGGLVAYTSITGSSYDNLICETPDWYQAVNSFLMLGAAPDCKGVVANPNADVVTGQVLVFGGFTMQYLGPGLLDRECMRHDGPIPEGYSLYVKPVGGTSWQPVSLPSTAITNRCTLYPSTNGVYQKPVHDVSTLRMATIAGGVAEATNNPVATLAEADEDPVRTPSCRIKWEDGTTTTGTGTAYRESEGLPASSTGLGCESAYVSKPGAGPDLLPEKISVDSDDGTSVTTIAENDVPPMTQPQRQALTAPSNGRGLVLSKVVNGALESCMTWEADCANWWDTSDEGSNDSTYRCTYGGNKVPLAECGPYRNTFQEATSTPTITDPAGEPQPWPSTGASPSSGAGTQTGGGGCALSWSWNPVDWVLNPVKCAFIPSTAKVDAFKDGIRGKWELSTPAKLAATLGAAAAGLGAVGDGNCGGVIVPFPQPGPDGSPVTQNRAFLAACPGDFFHPIAPWFFWLISASIVITGALGIKNRLDKLVNN